MSSFHSTLLSGKLWQAVHQATYQEGGVSSPGVCFPKYQATGCRRSPEENP